MVDVFLLSTTSQSVFVPLDLVTFDGIQFSDKVLHGAEAVFFTNFKYTGLGSFDVDVIFDVVDEDCTNISFEKSYFKEIEGYENKMEVSYSVQILHINLLIFDEYKALVTSPSQVVVTTV